LCLNMSSKKRWLFSHNTTGILEMCKIHKRDWWKLHNLVCDEHN
jgi:hypothetical protein